MNLNKMSDDQIEKWGRYFRFFYLHEEMSFGLFLERVQQGIIPKRNYVEWDKVTYQSSIVVK